VGGRDRSRLITGEGTRLLRSWTVNLSKPERSCSSAYGRRKVLCSTCEMSST
jgi:hypothetical protein